MQRKERLTESDAQQVLECACTVVNDVIADINRGELRKALYTVKELNGALADIFAEELAFTDDICNDPHIYDPRTV